MWVWAIRKALPFFAPAVIDWACLRGVIAPVGATRPPNPMLAWPPKPVRARPESPVPSGLVKLFLGLGFDVMMGAPRASALHGCGGVTRYYRRGETVIASCWLCRRMRAYARLADVTLLRGHRGYDPLRSPVLVGNMTHRSRWDKTAIASCWLCRRMSAWDLSIRPSRFRPLVFASDRWGCTHCNHRNKTVTT